MPAERSQTSPLVAGQGVPREGSKPADAAYSSTMKNEARARDEPSAYDRNEPTTNHPLSSEPTDERNRSVFYETRERAVHGGQWIASTATIERRAAR